MTSLFYGLLFKFRKLLRGLIMKKKALIDYYRAVKNAKNSKDKERAKLNFKRKIHKGRGPLCGCGELLQKAGNFLICWRCYNQD